MYRFAYRLCGEAEAAKDLVQETFLNAYRAYDRFRGDSQVSTWLYAIASHACQRMRRKRKGNRNELSSPSSSRRPRANFPYRSPWKA